MIPKSLERLRQNGGIVPIVDTAVGTLIQAGVMTFLREKAAPVILDGGESINKAAIVAAMSAGYNACLDDLLNFKERFIAERAATVTTAPDYGATESTIERGDLTKEEADAIRANKQFDHTSHAAAVRTDFATFQRKRLEHNAKSSAGSSLEKL